MLAAETDMIRKGFLYSTAYWVIYLNIIITHKQNLCQDYFGITRYLWLTVWICTDIPEKFRGKNTSSIFQQRLLGEMGNNSVKRSEQ